MRAQKADLVMDTNVAVVANGKAEQANKECVGECIARLSKLRNECLLLLDYKNLILDEYRKNLHPSGQPGPGDSFFKWLFENQANPKYCRRVYINLSPRSWLCGIPNRSKTISFDQDDRKFVAVALASGTNPKILNASDTDWWLHRNALQEHGIEVDIICLELMRA